MEYYYTLPENIKEDSLLIIGDEAEHLAKVLRKTTEEIIFVTDGEKNLYKSEITAITKKQIECRIIEKFYSLNEPLQNIYLYQSLLKNPARFEFAVEKSVELGVYQINPVITENTVNKKRNKSERWQAIALSAMKQSQRCYLPKVNPPQSYDDAIKSCNTGLKVIAHEKEKPETSIKINEILHMAQNANEISVFIGSEGGFTDGEIEIAISAGFKILSLGSRKFRSETAAITIMSQFLI